jgi:hypothetical protein
MDLGEDRDAVVRHYIESGRQERDNRFRRSLDLGPTERRWLGWAGARVLVLSVYQSAYMAPLCPTSWVYQFTPLNKDNVLLTSSEINFCDDDNVIELLYPWNQTESHISELRREIENPVLMYCI